MRIDPRKALLGAVLCTVTPIHSEAVNYVSGHSELLMAFFFLAAFLAVDAAYMAWTSRIIDIGPWRNPCALSMCSRGHNSKPRCITSRCSPCP